MSYEEENNSKEFPVQFGHGSHGFKDHKLKSTPKTDKPKTRGAVKGPLQNRMWMLG